MAKVEEQWYNDYGKHGLVLNSRTFIKEFYLCILFCCLLYPWEISHIIYIVTSGSNNVCFKIIMSSSGCPWFCIIRLRTWVKQSIRKEPFSKWVRTDFKAIKQSMVHGQHPQTFVDSFGGATKVWENKLAVMLAMSYFAKCPIQILHKALLWMGLW